MIRDKHFIDWESEVFGYGYGSGEEPILTCLKFFLDTLEGRGYDFRKLEAELGKATTWFMINTLAHADIIEYGTSPRFGWLTEKGELLRDYFRGKTVDELCNILEVEEGDYIHCLNDYCNCDKPCKNPLFK